MSDTARTRVVHVNDMDRYPDAIYIGRANGRKRLKASKWGNPFRVGKDGDLATVLAKYRKYQDFSIPELRMLAGKPLACWCRHDGEERTDDNACHGDILVALIWELGLEPSVSSDDVAVMRDTLDWMDAHAESHS